MFKQNKYTRWYNDIIHKAQIRTPDDAYYEKHHIIPECLGGVETVSLTPREHFVCHLLLSKMTDDRRMKYAAKAMTMHSKRRNIKVTSHTYAYIKRIHAESVSNRLKGQTKSDEHKRNMSDSIRKKWQDPIWQKKQMDSKKNTSQKVKDLWKDPVWREKMMQARKK